MISLVFTALTLSAVGVRARDTGLSITRIAAALLLVGLCMASVVSSPVACVWYFFAAVVLMLVPVSTITAVAFLAASAALLLDGARHPLWTSPPSLTAIGVFGTIAFAAANGVLRRGISQGFVFVLTLVAAMYDVRLAPLFALASVPSAL